MSVLTRARVRLKAFAFAAEKLEKRLQPFALVGRRVAGEDERIRMRVDGDAVLVLRYDLQA